MKSRLSGLPLKVALKHFSKLFALYYSFLLPEFILDVSRNYNQLEYNQPIISQPYVGMLIYKTSVKIKLAYKTMLICHRASQRPPIPTPFQKVSLLFLGLRLHFPS